MESTDFNPSETPPSLRPFARSFAENLRQDHSSSSFAEDPRQDPSSSPFGIHLVLVKPANMGFPAH